MVKSIVQLNESEEVLRNKNRELTRDEILSQETKTLIEQMKATMRSAPGVGLAAPQIGINIKLAVIEDPQDRLKDIPEEILKDRERLPVDFHAIINPIIVKKHGKIKYFFEGCLSVQGKVRVTPRYENVIVTCLDEHANERVIEASGWYARILQHEIDHLNGALYVDIADERTEMTADVAFRNKWMNASSEKIESLYLASLISGIPEILAKRVSDDLNAIVYKTKSSTGDEQHEIAFFNKLDDGRFQFSHKEDLKQLFQEFCSPEAPAYRIRQIGDPVLHKEARNVTDFSGEGKFELETQLAVLQRNLYVTGGVGIAANQCAEIENPLKIIVSGVNYKNPEHIVKAVTRYPTALFPEMRVLVNPVILKLDDELSEFTEGCLSVRGPIRGVVKRPKSVSVGFQDINGEYHEETYTGTDARVMLHELDHILNGLVYMERLIDELTQDQCRRLLAIVKTAATMERAEKPTKLFISPTTIFERASDGTLTFDPKRANDVFMEMSKETLLGIASKLQGV